VVHHKTAIYSMILFGFIVYFESA